ncbi:hypothetical protein B0H10DRAFT_2333487 [Mycena sp. CBHHK59/15]|nr:hypothetical protein B0H10DRAFT_2333487 [Mycena sp. CBHHK59/15]
MSSLLRLLLVMGMPRAVMASPLGSVPSWTLLGLTWMLGLKLYPVVRHKPTSRQEDIGSSIQKPLLLLRLGLECDCGTDESIAFGFVWSPGYSMKKLQQNTTKHTSGTTFPTTYAHLQNGGVPMPCVFMAYLHPHVVQATPHLQVLDKIAQLGTVE